MNEEFSSFNSNSLQSIQNYLSWMSSLPFKKTVQLNYNKREILNFLNQSHIGLIELKHFIINNFQFKQNILLVGSNGSGKRTICQSIAQATNREYVYIPLFSLNDFHNLVGQCRQSHNSSPGIFVRKMKNLNGNNPLIHLDGINEFYEVILSLLKGNFYDYYLDTFFDFSNALIIITTTATNHIPQEILNELKIIEIFYDKSNKFQIAKEFCKKLNLNIKPREIKNLIESTIYSQNIRFLQKSLMDYHSNHFSSFETFSYKIENKVGVSNGISVYNSVAFISSIESSFVDGSGKYIITGNLQKVIKESVLIAISILKKYFSFSNSMDLHVHFTNHSTIKDGSSAGLAIFSSLFSLINNIQINSSFAFSGEITLTGQILPVSNLLQKINSCLNNNIKTLFISKYHLSSFTRSKKYFNQILKKLNIVFLYNIEELIEYLKINK
jgi:ATP-dependent Lon protease